MPSYAIPESKWGHGFALLTVYAIIIVAGFALGGQFQRQVEAEKATSKTDVGDKEKPIEGRGVPAMTKTPYRPDEVMIWAWLYWFLLLLTGIFAIFHGSFMKPQNRLHSVAGFLLLVFSISVASGLEFPIFTRFQAGWPSVPFINKFAVWTSLIWIIAFAIAHETVDSAWHSGATAWGEAQMNLRSLNRR